MHVRFHHSVMHDNPALVSASFIDREAFNSVGGFDEALDWEEDWDLWLRLFQKYDVNGLGGLRTRVCYYWIDDEERRRRDAGEWKPRRHEVDYQGRVSDVHEYLHLAHGANPHGKFPAKKAEENVVPMPKEAK